LVVRSIVESDADLVNASRTGCRSAFRGIVERYRRRVFELAYRMVGDRVLAEDITQETMFVAWRDLRELRETDRLAGWLVGIARNLGRRSLRSRARRGLALQSLAMTSPMSRTPHDETVACEEQALLARGLRAMPDMLRRPLVLHYLEGRSVREVARGLTLTETAVKQRLMRGRHALRSAARA
jgi:RNA polymerase sigma-70 factor (ECF subfamily)